MKRFFFVFCQLLLIPEILVFTTVSFAIVTHTEAARASDQVADYATSREWLTLLHAEHHLSGFRSHVDGSGFFRASDGSINPTHELVTDLIELQNPASLFHCSFPLRAKRLIARFNLKPPVRPCVKLDEWLKILDAKSINMILASAFPEAPPSMFGHIFMQLSSAKTADLKQIGLFDQGLNFAAVIPKDAGIEMAYKGMFGGYEGHFTVAPFYQMLAEYSHTEERDLWIYKLNLSQAETTDLLLHVWEIEMNQSYLAYFFLDENCAYQLLSILQVIRPNTELTSGFGAYALPVTAIQFLEANGAFQ